LAQQIVERRLRWGVRRPRPVRGLVADAGHGRESAGTCYDVTGGSGLGSRRAAMSELLGSF